MYDVWLESLTDHELVIRWFWNALNMLSFSVFLMNCFFLLAGYINSMFLPVITLILLPFLDLWWCWWFCFLLCAILSLYCKQFLLFSFPITLSVLGILVLWFFWGMCISWLICLQFLSCNMLLFRIFSLMLRSVFHISPMFILKTASDSFILSFQM